MTEQEIRRVVEQVAAEILAAKQHGAECAPEGAEKVLVVGDIAGVPKEISRQAYLCGLDAYECDRNIAPYSKVIISGLTLMQLCDIAQGRPTDAACCAVIRALLNGKPVLLLEKGLPHREYAGKGSTALYAKLEGYVRTLSSFGVKLITEAGIYRPAEEPAKPPKYQKPATVVPRGSGTPNSGSVITEDIALGLVKDGFREIDLPRGAIVTPSAKDVFKKMGVTINGNL